MKEERKNQITSDEVGEGKDEFFLNLEEDFSPEDGEKLSLEDGEELSLEDGEELHPEDGEELMPEDGEELPSEEGEELSPEDGEELSLEDGEDFVPEEELLLEDGEDFEELTEEEKLERRKKRFRILRRVLLAILAVIVIAYGGISAFFAGHFYWDTTLNDMDVSLKSKKQVEEMFAGQVENYHLKLIESTGAVEEIAGTNINLKYKEDDAIGKLIKEQNPVLWPKAFWEESEIEAKVNVEYDDALLQQMIDNLDCMKEENQAAPVSAIPEFNGTEFVVKPEEVGSKIIPDTLNASIRTAISEFLPEVNLTEKECYEKAQFLSDSPEVINACTAMNQYLGAEVTYTLGSQTEVVGAAQIANWVTVDDALQVTFHNDQIAQYVADLAAKYDTRKTVRSFISGSGASVSVEGGDYGWQIDQEAEIAALEQNIANGEVISREPAYAYTAASHDGNDWGGTYVEVDLTNQVVYLFVNGEIIINGAPIVTGKPSAGDATPQGVYYIKYCTTNATLRGPKKADGTYEWESPVAYWMPFNGGIGLHDAPWQAAFGGSRYLTHGSHGCVNLQHNVAKTIYNNVWAGVAVVCHY